MVSVRYLALPLLCVIGFTTARPVPEPLDIGKLWNDIKGHAGNVLDNAKNALFPSKPVGSMSLLSLLLHAPVGKACSNVAVATSPLS
jgi:hypothetical protein